MIWDYAKSIAKIIQDHQTITVTIMSSLSFIFGSWLTAKYQWSIKKQKMKLERRRDLVDTWRGELIPILNAREQQWRRFSQVPVYAHLSLRELAPPLVCKIPGET